MADQPYTEADVERVAGILPGLIAMEHGCLPSQCDLTSDTEADGWRNIAKNLVAGLAAAGRLLPEGASMCGHEAPTIIEGARRYACHLPVGHEGWHGAPNDEQQPWAHWTERRKAAGRWLTRNAPSRT